MKPIRSMTAAECNTHIRQLQKEIQKSKSDADKDWIRGRIAVLAQQAAYMNRNAFQPTKD